MKYKVEWLENKTSAKGTNYKIITIKDETGAIFDSVSTFDPVELGGEYDGEIVHNGQYKNFKLKTEAKRSQPSGIKAAQERKQEMIEKSQESKDVSIKLSSTVRDATLITVAQFTGQNFTDEEFETRWKKWRNWLLDNWGNYQDAIDPLE